MYKKALYDTLPAIPLYLGGDCTCVTCSKMGKREMVQSHETGTSSSRVVREDDVSDNEEFPSVCLHPSIELELDDRQSYEKLLRTAAISVLVFMIVIALCKGNL